MIVLRQLWFLILCVLLGLFAPSRADARLAETRTWVFAPEVAETRLETEPQAVGTHQENELLNYEHAPGCTQAAENVAPAFSRLSPGGGLMTSENAGGHLLAKHVGQSEAQLAARLSAEPRISAASTFATRAEAEAGVSAAFDTNAARINSWASGGANGRLPLNAPFSGGTVLPRGGAAATQGTGVRVILQGNGSGGYHVLTGFPTP